MEKLPARAGWHWVKLGMTLFRKQPGALMALLFCCMFLALFSMVIVGGVLPFLLAPMFTVALLQGCADVDQGKRALPKLLLSGFRKPARRPLLGLGLLYLLIMLLALGVLSLTGSDQLMQMLAREIPMEQSVLEEARGPLFLSSLIYMLGWLLSCLAAPLIYWQKMTLVKALFFSVVAVFRGIKAFLTGAVVLYVLFYLGAQIPVWLLGQTSLAIPAIFTIFLIMVVLLHCTLYASYRQIFGPPGIIDEAA